MHKQTNLIGVPSRILARILAMILTMTSCLGSFADEKKVEDDALNKALVEAAQSDVIQVQDAANKALRAVSKPKS